MDNENKLNSIPLYSVHLKVDDEMNVLEELLFMPSPFLGDIREKMPADFLASTLACPAQYVIDAKPDSKQLQYIKDLAKDFRKFIKTGMMEVNTYKLEQLRDEDEYTD